MYLRILCFLFGLIASTASSDALDDNSTLYFGVFISQESDFDFSGFRPPLELGVKTINENDTVLKRLNEMNYYIRYELTNAKVSRFAMLWAINFACSARALLLPGYI